MAIPLTQEYLHKILEYQKETGIFYWLVSPTNSIKKGQRAGTVTRYGYRNIIINGKSYREGRLAYYYIKGEWPPDQIDHKDRQRDNNKWSNLRPVTCVKNAHNKSWKKIKHEDLPIGVQPNGSGFLAQCTTNRNGVKKNHYLGTYKTPLEAHNAYLSFKTKLLRKET